MGKPLRALIVETSADAAAPLLKELGGSGFDVATRVESSAAGIEAALAEGPWDVLLAPVAQALKLLKQRETIPPVIALARDTEEALEAMRAGALDAFPREQLSRLRPAVESALCAADDRRRREDEARLQGAVTENMVEGVVLVRAGDGMITYANRAFERMMGYAPGELTGQGISVVNATTERTPEETAAAIQQALLETGAWSGEVLNRRKDGSAFWCAATVTTFDDPLQGKIWISIHEDITERKHFEQELRESEEKYRAIVEHVSDIIFICEPDGKVTYITPNISGWGYEAPEVIGHAISEFVDPEDLVRVEEDLQRMVRTREAVTITARFRGKGGGVNYFESIGRPMCEGDRVVRFIGVMRDVTERRKSEERLQKLNRSLSTLSAANRALSRALEEGEFLNEISRIIVEVGGYRAVMIAASEDEAAKSFRPVVWHGWNEGTFEQAARAWAGGGSEECPAVRAIRQRGAVVVERLSDLAVSCPWYAQALGASPSSLAAFPLIVKERAIGVLIVVTEGPVSFDPEELDLLKELAGDTAYGIAAIRTRAELEMTEEEIERRMFQLARLNDLMIGREMRVIEVKREVNALLLELGRAPKYAV